MNSFAHTVSKSEVRSSGQAVAALREKVNERLSALLPGEEQQPAKLHRAMRFSLLGSGKRVRPLMCMLVCEAAGDGGYSFALDAGCAVEMVHTASLILDDLPCMDNAAMRRGRPTTHLEFGQSTAILASVGLLNRAFGVIAEHPGTDASVKAEALAVLSEAVGSNGMIAGQEIDLHERAKLTKAAPIEGVNWLKTGVLFVAAAHLGALAAGLEPARIDAVKTFAKHVGLAFQTADDLIDQTSDVQTAGKDVGQDNGTPTLVSLSGVEAARESCDAHLSEARVALAESGVDGSGLQALVDTIFGART